MVPATQHPHPKIAFVFLLSPCITQSILFIRLYVLSWVCCCISLSGLTSECCYIPYYMHVIYIYVCVCVHYPGYDITSQQDAGAAFAWVLCGTCSPSAAPLVLGSSVGRVPLLLLPLYLQPGTSKPVQMPFLQRACESPYRILSGKPWASLSITLQDLPLGKIGP